MLPRHHSDSRKFSEQEQSDHPGLRRTDQPRIRVSDQHMFHKDACMREISAWLTSEQPTRSLPYEHEVRQVVGERFDQPKRWGRYSNEGILTIFRPFPTSSSTATPASTSFTSRP